MKKRLAKYVALAGLLLASPALMAQEIVAEVATTPTLNAGNTAWIIVATVLVLMMTIPGLAFFYGGLVRQKNVLSIMMQCLILTAVITIEWVII